MSAQVDSLSEVVEAHLRATGVSPTRFGVEAVRDPRFVFQLRNGREPRKATRERVLRYIGDASRDGSKVVAR